MPDGGVLLCAGDWLNAGRSLAPDARSDTEVTEAEVPGDSSVTLPVPWAHPAKITPATIIAELISMKIFLFFMDYLTRLTTQSFLNRPM